MSPEQFEAILTKTSRLLTAALREHSRYHGPAAFEKGCLEMLKIAARECDVVVEPTFHPHAFPDIKVNGYGIEVKYSKRDTWHTVGNSVFEGMRDESVRSVYVLFGKIGGTPEVRWGRYEECITHVRTSNSPRFVLDMEEGDPLFKRFGISYEDFTNLDVDGKMAHVRDYWRDRLKRGERLWWLEEAHTLPMKVQLYMHLSPEEKLTLRAEAALLCPQICKGSRQKGKYEDAAMYLLTYHGVFCPQARDLFSAGSVAMRTKKSRGGNYVLRALQDIEDRMRSAAESLDDALFEEYWGQACAPEKRLREWLRRADGFAKGWKPSKHLFVNDR